MTRLTPSFVGDIVLGVVGGRMTGGLVVFRSLRPVHFAREIHARLAVNHGNIAALLNSLLAL